MAARTRSLTNLMADVRYACDIEGATGRHPDANLTRLLNQSIQRYRVKLSEAELPYYLTSATGTLTAGTVSSTQPWAIIDMSSYTPQAAQVFGVHLLVNSDVIDLAPVPWTQVLQYDLGGRTSVPTGWSSYDRDSVIILPAPDSAYTYRLHYLPIATDLSAGGDTFDPGVAGGEEWVIYDVCSKLLLRDDYPDLIGAFEMKRNEIWLDIMSHAARRNRTGPMKRHNDRDRRKGRILRDWLSR